MKFRHINIKKIGPFNDFDINFTDEDENLLDIIVIVGENNLGKSLILNAVVSCLTATHKSSRSRGELIEIPEGSEIRLITDYGEFVQTHTMEKNETNIDLSNRMIIYFDSQRTLHIGKDLKMNGQQFLPRSSNTSLSKTNVPGRGCDRLIAIESQLLMIKKENDKIFNKALITMTEIVEPYYTIRAHGNSVVCQPENHRNTVPLNEIGDGFKNLLIIVGELLCRYITANQTLIKDDSYMTKIRSTPAICLIDDIELHLHPKIQSGIIPKLHKIFPKTQFIITTHAPLIISEVAPNSIFQLIDNSKDTETDEKKDHVLNLANHKQMEYRCPENDIIMTIEGCFECDRNQGCDKYVTMLDELGKSEEA